eukprot:4382198-Pyramimonas_sp.AAC.1
MSRIRARIAIPSAPAPESAESLAFNSGRACTRLRRTALVCNPGPECADSRPLPVRALLRRLREFTHRLRFWTRLRQIARICAPCAVLGAPALDCTIPCVSTRTCARLCGIAL